jgi:hypothetical protein
MKSKIIALGLLSMIAFSCATKAVATKEVKTVVLTKELAEGKGMYENNCAKCHKLYDATAFSKEDWKPILVSMQKKAKLGDVEMASISNYITSQL